MAQLGPALAVPLLEYGLCVYHLDIDRLQVLLEMVARQQGHRPLLPGDAWHGCQASADPQLSVHPAECAPPPPLCCRSYVQISCSPACRPPTERCCQMGC